MKKRISIIFTILFIFMFPFFARAELFTIHIIQGSLDETASFSSVLDLFDKYEHGELDSIINGYNKNLPAEGVLNFRGVNISLNFDNSGNLSFKVPSIGIDMNFNSSNGTQEDAFNKLKDYLEANQDGLLKKILNATVSETPYDLVAGNPNSMMSMMTNSSFDISRNNMYGAALSHILPSASKHKFSFQGENVEADVFSLPLAYSFKFGNSGWALILDMPLTYMDIDGSVSYAVQLGASLNIPLKKEYWNLVIGTRAGAVGSEDMLSGGVLYGTTIASNFQIPVNKWEFGMTNLFGVIRDYSLKIAEYEIEYSLKNQVFKNGFDVVYNFTKKYSTRFDYNYTFFTGSKLFIDSYHDLSLSLTRKFAKGKFIEGISLVGSYAFDGDVYKSYKLGLSVLF